MIALNHFNHINVMNPDRSIQFYKEALELHVVREEKPTSGSFRLVFLGDDSTNFNLELTWQMTGGMTPGSFENCDYNMAVTTDRYEELHTRHQEMGCICLENPDIQAYFIRDPDGYMIAVTPKR